MRSRKQVAREQSSHVQGIQKTLTEANIRMDAAISDIMGLNGRCIIEAMIAGERHPRKLVALTDRRLKADRLLDEAIRQVEREADAPRDP